MRGVAARINGCPQAVLAKSVDVHFDK